MEYPGPISSFAAKTDLAYMLGLIGPGMYADLGAIRQIRNQFGHSHHPATFADPQIEEICKRLEPLPFVELEMDPSPRSRFLINAALLSSQLMLRGLAQKHAALGKDFAMGEVVKRAT